MRDDPELDNFRLHVRVEIEFELANNILSSHLYSPSMSLSTKLICFHMYNYVIVNIRNKIYFLHFSC